VSITFLENGVTLNFSLAGDAGCFHCIAPSNFHLFGPLKHHLSAEHFPDDEAVEREVAAWFQQQPKEFSAAGFQRLVKRWDKCFNVQGDYVEK
jgi:hypothetical protein